VKHPRGKRLRHIGRLSSQLPPMTTTAISKFRREFDAFLKYSRCELVEITRDGRRTFVLMSAEHYDWIRAASRRAHRTSHTTTIVINAV
jgi:prevent-host-death family protein